jgi:hypothetical protein
MDASDEFTALDAEGDESEVLAIMATTPSSSGLHPAIAVLVALWYSFIAAAAMSSGFAFLYKHSENDYYLAQNLMWTVGIGIGIAIAVCLAKRSGLAVGVVSSVIMSGLLLSLLYLIPNDEESEVSVFGYSPSLTQFLIAIAVLTLFTGLLGTAAGKSIRTNESMADTLLGIRHRHWFWLWLGLYAWVAILPTGIYYIWLEVISTGYVLIHPSLWISEAWTEGWTVTFGIAGFSAVLYGVDLSLRSVSAKRSLSVQTRKRVLQFLLGTLILAGPVASTLFYFAISSLIHLPDGITQNPWWILR